MGYYIKVIFIINMVTLTNSVVTINRVIGTNNFYEFYHATDTFTNLKQQESFCKEYNAECLEKSCMTCTCAEDYIFVSYLYGCVTYDNAVGYLNGTMCLVYRENADFLPAVTSDTFQDNKCKKISGSKYLNISFIYQKYNSCAYSGVEIYNSLYGIKDILPNKSLNDVDDILWKKVNLSFLVDKKNGEICLQGNFNGFTIVTGKIVKMLINCQDVNQSFLNTCILFKYAGNYNIDIDFIQSTQNKSTTGIIVGVCLACLCLLLIVLLFVFWLIRRRKPLSVTTDEDAEKENDYQEIATRYETIPDESLKRKSFEEVNAYYSSEVSKEELNPYYAQQKKNIVTNT
ncbi:uncharacterized protein LOC101238985 isoform X1 [Hydra vulgaris]|uniref:uncharacterized protein LOC101238985 isoform X1 n=1 Tax=Hydra vulgaris TaxID=6087 RepID=UPI001F5E9D19|nr:uncharacterized protein LOC101238985 [Hydra vulgaris]XP_047146648.1 uncharacterized protein LOC101238985 [Hydra vulgaris]XP_047146649.1 uncharacterized protein LOC101238985 [Hydra vulgaris]